MKRSETPTANQGFVAPSAEVGILSGFVLKLIRGSLGMTQDKLAELLEVDASTVQGWESGRRPLPAQRAADLLRLRTRLTMHGAQPAAVSCFQEALEGDGILAVAIAAGGQPVRLEFNPLAAAVHRRSLVNMITWPFTGLTPPKLRSLPSSPGRGPVAKHPLLNTSDQRRFFDHLIATADPATASSTPLLRRQATYLLGFDSRQESAIWLATEHKRAFAAGAGSADPTAGIAARSATLALARRGDPDPLKYFIKHTLSSDKHAAANLAYWAYWLGEIPDSYPSDRYLVAAGDDHTWSGGLLASHLLQHLDNDIHGQLNIHSFWTLVLARPDLLRQHASLRTLAAARVERALDGGFDREARDELINLRYAVQLANR
ncbi:helix-turn-helix domain-containing protein [Kribbella deserti]|uniref:Helix-turn-helix domain-containing protein n=1 Tax=Kribbella deserti TaxID=1926257 RepID=A0ABV6QV27_9ACTN